MSDQELEQTPSPAPERGLGYGRLAMNEIAASATEEPSEVARRTSAKWLWVIVVVAVAVLGAWFLRSALNLPPSLEVQRRVEGNPAVSAAMQQGLIHRLTFISGSKIRADFSPNRPTTDDAARKALRQVAAQLLNAFVDAQPNRDLYVIGFQGDDQMLEARYLNRSTLVTKSGEKARDITVRIKGDPAGGIASDMRGQTPTH